MLKRINTVANKAVYRFRNAFQNMGAVQHPKDTRSTEEIMSTINEILSKNPQLENFSNEISKMNPKHLNLVADTLELAQMHELLPMRINMFKEHPKTGKSLIQSLLEVFPKASKENPGALEFAQEVINNTDSTTSKYFLSGLLGIINDSSLSEIFRAAKPMVKEIAEQTLKGGYNFSFSKQEDFMRLVNGFVNKGVKPDKLELLPSLLEAAEKMEGVHKIYIDRFLNSSAAKQTTKENIEILPEITKLFAAQGKEIDVVEFATKNINLT